MQRHARDMERHARDMERHSKDMAILEEIKAELKKDKLIGNEKAGFTFRISDEGLFVNDKKQPDAVFRKYEKMVKDKTANQNGEKFNYQINVTH